MAEARAFRAFFFWRYPRHSHVAELLAYGLAIPGFSAILIR
jgi:hypothetical protein